MSVDDLLAVVLRDIWTSFYEPRSREFFRDRPALLRAISHFGYECEQRGWNPDPEFIATEILAVLRAAKQRKAHIGYLPVYLHEAIRRCVGQRAEEIQANSSSVKQIAPKILEQTTRVSIIRQPTSVEILSTLYKSLNNNGKKITCPKCKQIRLL